MEQKVLVQAIRDSTLPKLIAVDACITEQLLLRLFPETTEGKPDETMMVLMVHVYTANQKWTVPRLSLRTRHSGGR